MKKIVFISAMLAIYSDTARGGAWDTFVKTWNGYLYLLYDSYQDYLINLKVAEIYIDKPLPPDWIPHSDPKKRTKETELKFQLMEKKKRDILKAKNEELAA